jgi:hypothetical protein
MSQDNRRALGKLGEDLFARLEYCILSEDVFDSEKDGIDINGKTVEIKTQYRFHSRNLFTIRADKQTNFDKCMTVDRLIFVEYNVDDTINVFECTNRKDYVKYKTSFGVPMIGWNVDDMKKLYSINDAKLAEHMRSLSGSQILKNDINEKNRKRSY